MPRHQSEYNVEMLMMMQRGAAWQRAKSALLEMQEFGLPYEDRHPNADGGGQTHDEFSNIVDEFIKKVTDHGYEHFIG